MPGTLQPLVNNQRIVNADGTPTEYFIRWAQTKQIDLQGAVTAEQALQIAVDYIAEFTAAHPLAQGSGITITPSDGNIGHNLTVAANVQQILDQISTTRGSVLYRGAAAWAALAPGTSGQFLKTNGAGADPTWATASGGGGSGLFAVNAPPAALTTWVNQGATTKTVQTDGTVTLVAPFDGADNVRAVFAPLPATPWSYKIGWLPTLAGVGFQHCGVALRESSSGKMIVLGTYRESGGVNLWFIANYNSPTSKNANVLIPSAPITLSQPVYLTLADNGTTRSGGFGYDPYNQPFAPYSVAHSSFIVPDQIGIYVNNLNASNPCGISAFSWQ